MTAALLSVNLRVREIAAQGVTTACMSEYGLALCQSCPTYTSRAAHNIPITQARFPGQTHLA